MNGTTISIVDTATPVLDRLAKYGPDERRFVNQFIGEHVQSGVRDYLRDNVATRHTTAERLGASPTNFWGPAIRSVSQPDAVQHEPDGVSVTIISPGISRVDHDVTIKPGEGKQWLTLPVNAPAYGNRYEIGVAERARFDKDDNLLPPTKPGAPLYLFVKEAHLKQDRTLLPSDAAIEAAALEGAAEGVDALITKLESEQGGTAA